MGNARVVELKNMRRQDEKQVSKNLKDVSRILKLHVKKTKKRVKKMKTRVKQMKKTFQKKVSKKSGNPRTAVCDAE